MRIVVRHPSIAIAIAISALIVVACGKHEGSPTAPTPPGANIAPAPSGSTSGATTAGTVVGGFGTSRFRPTAAARVVTVVGTSHGATVDCGGRFTLLSGHACRL